MLARVREAVATEGRDAGAGLALVRAGAVGGAVVALLAGVDELIAAGTLEDFTSDKTQLDRELEALTTAGEVDAELARLKGELGAGQAAKEIEEGKAT